MVVVCESTCAGHLGNACVILVQIIRSKIKIHKYPGGSRAIQEFLSPSMLKTMREKKSGVAYRVWSLWSESVIGIFPHGALRRSHLQRAAVGLVPVINIALR